MTEPTTTAPVVPTAPTAPPERPAAQADTEVNLRLLLQEMIQKGASDLHVTAGARPKIRLYGELSD